MVLRTILFLSIFLGSQAFAQVQNVAGSSLNVNTPPTESWGVFVGEYDLARTSGGYNNCDLEPEDGAFEGCHDLRVNGDTAITVQFNYTGATAATGLFPIAYIERTTTSGTVNDEIETNRTNVSIGDGTATVSFTWRELCVLLKSPVDGTTAVFFPETQKCSLSGRVIVSFGIGLDANTVTGGSPFTFIIYNPDVTAGNIAIDQCGETASSEKFGFCDIAVKPGDSGGFLEPTEGVENQNTVIAQSFSIPNFAGTTQELSSSLNIEVQAIRLYAATEYINTQPWTNSVRGFENDISSFDGNTAVFDETSFGSLTNDTTYFLRAATVDSSGTVSQLFNASFENVYSITPSEVAGIIRENSCFITTATYGSDQAYQVNLFRQFRKMFLYENNFGRKVILLYNTYGPMGADWIRQNPSSKGVMRALLYPFYGFAYLSIHYGLFTSFCLLAALIFMILYLFRLKKEGDE